MTLSYQITFY